MTEFLVKDIKAGMGDEEVFSGEPRAPPLPL